MNITLTVKKKNGKTKADQVELTQSISHSTSIQDMAEVLAIEKKLNKLFTEYNFQFDLGYK